MQRWTEDALANLPRRGGFRLRGAQISRLEAFTDAAFAFGVTLLVISVDDVPASYPEFLDALRSVPVFLMCFSQLMLFWWGHHTWSRRYGMEDGPDLVLSLALVATVLVYVYPLRAMFSAFVANATEGSLGNAFTVTHAEVGSMFLVFGIGFATMAGLVALHFLRALLLREKLNLNPIELHETRMDVIAWAIVAATGVCSALLAGLLPDEISPASAYLYYTLAISMPLIGWITNRTRPTSEHNGPSDSPPQDPQDT